MTSATAESAQLHTRHASAVTLVVLLSAGLLLGCSSSRSGADRRAPADRHAITEQELDAAEVGTTVFQLVERTRPRWLHGRGPTRITGRQPPLVVYVDNYKHGGVDVLLRYRAQDIAEIRYLDSIEATRQFGTGHVSGAIVLRTRTASM